MKKRNNGTSYNVQWNQPPEFPVILIPIASQASNYIQGFRWFIERQHNISNVFYQALNNFEEFTITQSVNYKM